MQDLWILLSVHLGRWILPLHPYTWLWSVSFLHVYFSYLGLQCIIVMGLHFVMLHPPLHNASIWIENFSIKLATNHSQKFHSCILLSLNRFLTLSGWNIRIILLNRIRWAILWRLRSCTHLQRHCTRNCRDSCYRCVLLIDHFSSIILSI